MSQRKRLLDDLEQDIRDHIERETEDNIARGMSPEKARYAAMRKFGNVMRVKEETREVWSFLWLEQLIEDIRFGLRLLRLNLGFTVVAVLTLALGIGANSYIFSMVDAMVLRPMEFPDGGRIQALWERIPVAGVENNELSPANYLDWKAQNHVFDHMGAQSWWDVNLGGVSHPEYLHGFMVTPDYFEALQTQPMLGRVFLPEEGVPGKDHVAVLSYALWRDHFAADGAVVGKSILLNEIPYDVVGVMGPDFNFPSGAQVWGALSFAPDVAKNRGSHYLHSVAHLAPGESPQHAQAEMSSLAARLSQQYPQTNTGRDIRVMPLVESEVGRAKAPMVIMLAAVGLVLLIACANISNLLLARASSRQRETAIRAALGATRWRLIRQRLVESMLLGLLGGGVGIVLAHLCLDLQLIRIPAEFSRMIPGFNKIAINTSVVIFTTGVSLGTGIIFGFLPALGASRLNVNNTLKEGSPAAGLGRRRGLLRKVLIVGEVALSLTLLSTAGLMMKSFVRLEQVSPGFNPDHVLTMFVALPEARYTSDQMAVNFYEQLLGRVQAIPSVKDVAAVNLLPLGGANTTWTIRIEGQPEPKPGQEPDANFRAISDSYFRAMQIPMLRGRDFSSQDSAKSQLVVAVNQAFAARFWPGQDAIGKRMRFSGPLAQQPWYTVVGVVGDVRNQLDVAARPEMYFSLRQHAENTMALVVRTATDPRSMTDSVSAQVLALDRDLPVFQVMTMEDWRSVSVIAQKIGGTLMGAFAGFALVLAATGLFGVIAYAVSERTREIGIRMALGAGHREVLGTVVGQGMVLAGIGLLVGLPLALGMGRAVSGLLYGVAPNDLAIFAAVMAMLGAVALTACYLPARRAMRVDPIVALRYE